MVFGSDLAYQASNHAQKEVLISSFVDMWSLFFLPCVLKWILT